MYSVDDKCIYSDEMYCLGGDCETCIFAKEIKLKKLLDIKKQVQNIQLSIDDILKDLKQ